MKIFYLLVSGSIIWFIFISVSGADAVQKQTIAGRMHAGKHTVAVPSVQASFMQEAWIDNKPVIDAGKYAMYPVYILNFERSFYTNTVTIQSESPLCSPDFSIAEGDTNSCLRLQYPSSNSGQSEITKFFFDKDECPELRPTHLLFWVKSDRESGRLGVSVWSDNVYQDVNVTFVDVSDYAAINHDWSLVSIPLKDFGFELNAQTDPCICFVPFSKNDSGVVFVDDIRLYRIEPADSLENMKSKIKSSLRNRFFLRTAGIFTSYSNYTDYMSFHSARCCNMVYADLRLILNHDDPLKDPVMTIVFSNKNEFNLFLQDIGFNPGKVRGIYISGYGYNLICSYIDANDDEAFVYSSLVHETAHLVLHSYLDRVNIPLWLDEGIAQYYECNTSEYGNISREDKQRRQKYLNSLSECRLSLLLQSFDRKYTNDVYPLGAKYLYAYSFVTYLYHNNFMAKVIANINAGMSSEQALTNACGTSITELEKNWHLYLQRNKDIFR
ncbi:MAG: hypothetical protein C4541_03440 [Candidatus Auribacter fodinae]|jgi:hypothetical protein|uniref:Peptidase MA-like domain-containing protein n=1 Tax=Candidatus Auribacter fodinae TaxID=2093366 RepID=A0A3A4RGY9_9BACT|nr:MAG: hypothetical protein C4541_03440 [Candidatus Auribacter fodinae]